MLRFLLCALLLTLLAGAAPAAAPFEDSLAQRTLACTACHGKQGRAGPDGYYPRLAGKPAGYLYQQLLNFRDGRRHYALMAGLLAPLSDAYLMEIAQYFSALEVPYPSPQPTTATRQMLDSGRLLVTQGDASKKIPACTDCHGQALTGAAPNVPGLLGLPRDYLNAQLGGWQTGQRHAQEPDCMAELAQRLSAADVAAIAHWLAAQTPPADTRPLSARPAKAAHIQCGRAPAPSTTPAAPSSVAGSPPSAAATLVAQGAYLARAGNCGACHSTRGGTPYAGGRAIETPFGTVYSSNLTADPATGLGRWSAADFWQAMHQGRSRDGRLLYPAFPYTSFTQITRADSDALFAYLQTVPAHTQPNRAHDLRWPYSTQTALAAWRAWYFEPGVYQPDSRQGADWNRGAYLVRGLGHCAACHTPRNALGASQDTLDLAGGLIPMQHWYAPSLRSPLEAGVSGWQPQHIVALLKTGVAAPGSASGPMAEVVLDSTQYLSQADLSAVAVYLQSLATPASPAAGKPGSAQRDETAPSASGKEAKLYERHCAGCHGEQGEGHAGAYPALAHNRAVTLPSTTNLIQMVLHGGFAPATAGNPRPFGMPPFVLQMSDKDTAGVLTYIRKAWGNIAPAVSELDVKRVRDRQTR
jgi:cytochrome c553